MSLKRAVITPIIKKPSLDPDELKNYRPVSSLPFLSKVIERQVVNTITDHMIDNNLGEPLQSSLPACAQHRNSPAQSQK